MNATLLSLGQLASTLDGNGAARFATVLYRAKGTGELARHTILFNVNRTRALRRDIATLVAKRKSLVGIDAEACDELIASMRETVETGSNSKYTKAGYYDTVGGGNVAVAETGVAYVRGYSIRKEVIELGVYKQVKSAAKTIAKDKLRKGLKNTRIREFRITVDNFVMARAEGKGIVIDATLSGLNHLVGLPPVTLAVPVPA